MIDNRVVFDVVACVLTLRRVSDRAILNCAEAALKCISRICQCESVAVADCDSTACRQNVIGERESFSRAVVIANAWSRRKIRHAEFDRRTFRRRSERRSLTVNREISVVIRAVVMVSRRSCRIGRESLCVINFGRKRAVECKREVAG